MRRSVAAAAVVLALAGCEAPAQTSGQAAVVPAPPGVASAPPHQPVPLPGEQGPAGATASTDRPAVPAAPGGTALALLATIPVKGRAPKTGYGRDQYGAAWADADRNGCDTRNDMLARDLTSQAVKAGTGNCVILSGTLADPFTGMVIRFVRGGASEVDIDHVVALSDSWQKGAAQWEPRKRLAFANDPLNLLAVEASANRQKSDSDAASWLPSNKAFRCRYVARQIAVKARYGIWVTAAERDAMVRVLTACPDEPAPTGTAPTVAPIAAGAPRPRPSVTSAPGGSSDVYYANCSAARAAGAAPLRRGEPGYRGGLDRDGDGIACE